MREHYKLPTVDDVLPMLRDAKVFSKLDVKNAYWHVCLDEQSSLLTIMITPFGRFRWARLPFGLKVSSEIFQRHLTEALSGLDGIFPIADDITVAGCSVSKNEALKDNNAKLEMLYKRCEQRHIVLNQDKGEIGKSEIHFHGHLFTDQGVKADKRKIEAILNMPAPSDAAGVRRLCGMVQYLARFLPNLSSDLDPMRALTRKDCEWNWSPECEAAFEKIKTKHTETPVLSYFDTNKKTELQIDSSKDGIGAVIMQEGRPVEYASRYLSPSERNWAQIEKELLSVVFGLERFDQYTYGIKVTVQNDHRLLAAILNRPLSQAPRRLQALLMRVYRYDVEFQFVKGTELFIADTLSRAFLETNDQRSRIMTVDFSVNVSDICLREIRDATAVDTKMNILKSYILNGWPERNKMASELTIYHNMRDILSYEDGIILKGEAILIPSALQGDITKRLHSAHMGYNSMIRRARSLVYWPSMSRDIKQVVDTCAPCQELRPHNQKETLKIQDDGNGPWDKVSSDLFEIDGRQYLVVVDHFSNFIEIDSLQSTTSTKIVSCPKKHFSRFGIPRILTTDPGP